MKELATGRTRIGAIVVAALGFWPGVAASQVPASRTFNPVTSYAAENLLRKAADQANQGQWAEALDLYQKVISGNADAMAKVPKGDPMADPSEQFVLYVDARQHGQTRIAAMPPEARALYRSRIDAQAERWFRQGAADRDREAARKVLDQAFCSSWGDDALDLLGDMAFQDGQFAEALNFYRRIVPDPGVESPGLAHPDPRVDPARVAAKKLLCRAAMGIDPPEPEDLRTFAATYPEATGGLTGRTGSLSDSLSEALAEDHLAIPPQSDGRWPTFAGSPSRSKVLPGPIDVGLRQWTRKLDAPQPAKVTPSRNRMGFAPVAVAPLSPESQLAFFPVILGDQVVVCDEGKILAYHLNARDSAEAAPGQAEEVFAWDQKLRSPYAPPAARTAANASPRFTLTAHGDRIYARLGGSGGGGSGGGTIVAVRNNRDVEGKRIWEKTAGEIALPRARADAPGRISNASFEGTPVADDRGVYVALTEPGTEIGVYVACLDAETGATRWVKYLGTATVADPAALMNGMGMGGALPSGWAGNRLLSLDGPTLYYQTNLGAVASLDSETGAIGWLTSYPTRDRTGVGPLRDANPALVHDGLVIVAPDDALPIFAFEAATGRLAWKTEAMEKVTHLLGVAKGRLIATGNRVYTWDVKDPKTADKARRATYWPETSQDGYGRGLLAGDSIYWPTKTEIYVLDQASGAPGLREPIRLMQDYGVGGGNLAAGDGYLVVAQKDSLVVFAQNSRLIDRYRLEIAKNPGRALTYFQLARVAEASGQDELALENLEEAIRRARPSDAIDGQPLDEEALAKRYKLLKKLAERAAKEGDWAGEARRFEAAAKAARNDRDRLAARLHLAAAQTRAGDSKAAVDTLQAVLDDPKLRSQAVTYDDRWTVRADLWIADKLATMIEEGGPELYEEYDQKAEALLARGREDVSPRDLEEVGRAYPAAKVAGEALLALGELREREPNPSEAARAYRRLVSVAGSDSMKARALLGLARASGAQGLLLPAREALARAQAKYGEIRLENEDATVGSVVAVMLGRPPFDKIAAGPIEPILPVPLRRVWERSFGARVRPITAEGVPPSPASPRLFLVEKDAFRPIDPLTGDSSWSADLGEEPTWIGYVGNRLIAASATRLVAVIPDTGAVRWRYPEEADRPRQVPINPFATPPGAGRGGDIPDVPLGRLHDFRVAGDRVFLQRGDRQFLALDGETGQVEWIFAPASGGINPNSWVGSSRVVLQLVEPEALVVLDADTGRHREFPRDEPAAESSETGWKRPPLPIGDDHVAVAVDPHTVALLDLRTGEPSWTSRVASPALPLHVTPRILGDASRLLVLFEGNELVRLDVSTGRRLWSRALGLKDKDLGESPEAIAIDGDRFYCATGTSLAAYNLSDGRPAWVRPLTGPRLGWSIALADRHVTAYPSPSRSGDGALNGLALVVCRRDDGTLVQRLSFPETVSDLAVGLLPRGAIVATQGGAWALGESRVVDGPRPAR